MFHAYVSTLYALLCVCVRSNSCDPGSFPSDCVLLADAASVPTYACRNQSLCESGYACSNGFVHMCGPGESAGPGSVQCSACSAGKYQANNASSACIDCSPGTYQKAIGFSSCFQCPPTFYVDQYGASQCVLCSTSLVNDNHTACASACPAGMGYEAVNQSCIACPIGTYTHSCT